MRIPAVLLVATAALGACGSPDQPLAPASPVFHHAPGHANALTERAWGADIQWELLKPRPPGLGTQFDELGQPVAIAPGLQLTRVRVYQIAPVNAGDPLSPPIHIPGVISVGGRDHVLQPPGGGAGGFRAVAQTVPVLVPGWHPAPPFDALTCALPDLHALGIADRIAWRWLDPAPHPCGRAPQVYAARLNGESCMKPLTSVERLEAAEVQGLVQFVFPPEPPWPYAVRPLTSPRQGRTTVAAPACVG